MSIRQGSNIIAGKFAVNQSIGIEVDDETIIYNSDDALTAIGVQDLNTGAVKYDWIGTEAEYEQAWANGQISETDVCFVTDDYDGNIIVQGHSKTVGEIFNMSAPTGIDGCQLLDGTLIDGTKYIDFYEWCLENKQKAISGDTRYDNFNKTLEEYRVYEYRNGDCPYFVVDETATTVLIPTYKMVDINNYACYYFICIQNILSSATKADVYNMVPPLGTLLSDHVLTGEDAIGWVLQGSRVSATFETALNHVKNDKLYGSYEQDKVFNKLWTDRLDNHAAAITEEGIATFSNHTDVRTPSTFNPGTNEWVLNFKIRTTSDVITNQTIIHSNYGIYCYIENNRIALSMSSNGTSWNMINNYFLSTTIRTNTYYWFRLRYIPGATTYAFEYSLDGTSYTAGTTFVSSVAVNPAVLIFGNNINGTGFFKGSIDLLECDITINNSEWWAPYLSVMYVKAVDGHKIVDISNKSIIDEIYSRTGVAMYYIFDENNNCFYLPRCDSFMGLSVNANDVGKYGQGQIENALGSIPVNGISDNYSGALYSSGTTTTTLGTTIGTGASQLNLDLGRYVNTGDRVQPPHGKFLLYYRVGNTVINEDKIDFGNIVSDIGLLQLDVSDLQQNKLDSDLENMPDNVDYVIESWNDSTGSSGYKKFKSGFLIQWGKATTPGVGEPAIISFPSIFSQVPYLTIGRQYGGSAVAWTATYSNLTRTGVNIYTTQGATEASIGEFCWMAVGY